MEQAHKTVFGVVHRKGLSKSSGQPYDMCMLLTGNPVKPVTKPGMQFDGVGMELKEMDADPTIIDQARQGGYVFPMECLVTLQARFDDRGEARAVAVGIDPAKKAAK